MISVIEETQAFIDVLNANVDSIIMNEEVTDDKESITAEKDAEDGKWHVRGSIVNTCTKLDTEFFKLLQNSDQHSEEYRTNLKSNAAVIKIFQSAVTWPTNSPMSNNVAKCTYSTSSTSPTVTRLSPAASL